MLPERPWLGRKRKKNVDADNKNMISKGHVTRGNLSLQLVMQFLPKKILQVAVRMSNVRNLFCDLQ